MTVRKENQWMHELGINDEVVESMANALRPSVEEHDGELPYAVFENIIRKEGYTVNEAKKIIGVLYSKGIFVENIVRWENKSIELKRYIKDVDNERI